VYDGFVPPRDVIDGMEEAECVLLPYLSATQSGVVAAAFANGCYVIASAVGGLPDVVADEVNGLLIPPNDPQALANAIKRVSLDNVLRERLAEGAKVTAETQLRWSRIASTLHVEFTRLVNDKPRRRS